MRHFPLADDFLCLGIEKHLCNYAHECSSLGWLVILLVHFAEMLGSRTHTQGQVSELMKNGH